MMCRLEPNLPLSVGFRPVSWPPGGLAPKSHQCWLGSNQLGHVREGEPAWRDFLELQIVNQPCVA